MTRVRVSSTALPGVSARRRAWEAGPPEERIARRLQFWEAGRRRKAAAPTEAEVAATRAARLAQVAKAGPGTLEEDGR